MATGHHIVLLLTTFEGFCSTMSTADGLICGCNFLHLGLLYSTLLPLSFLGFFLVWRSFPHTHTHTYFQKRSVVCTAGYNKSLPRTGNPVWIWVNLKPIPSSSRCVPWLHSLGFLDLLLYVKWEQYLLSPPMSPVSIGWTWHPSLESF